MARRWGTTMFTLVALCLLGALIVGWHLYPANGAIRKEVVGSTAKSPVDLMEAAQQQQLIQDLKKEVAQMKVQLKQAPAAEPQGFWLDTQCGKHEVTQSSFPSVDEVLKKSGSKAAASMGSEGGEWTACTHLKIYGMNLAVFFLRFLAFHVKPATVMEFGCGLGTTADFLARFTPGGSRVTCIEPEPMLREVFGKKPLPHRATQLAVNLFKDDGKACGDALIERGFDLVLSVEVAEHIPVEYHPKLIKTLAKATRKLLVFSASRPEQQGTGHLLSSSFVADEWVTKFEAEGLVYLPKLTEMARKSARPERAYDLLANLIVMRAANVDDQALLNDDTDEADLMFHNKMFPYRTLEWRMQTNDGEVVTFKGDHHKPIKVLEDDISKKPIGNNGLGLGAPKWRDEFISGYTAALFPELDLLKRRMLAGEELCA